MTDKKMRINPDIKKILLNLEKLLQTPSVTGNTSEIISLLKDQFEKMGYVAQVLPKGGLLVKIRGGEGSATAFLGHFRSSRQGNQENGTTQIIQGRWIYDECGGKRKLSGRDVGQPPL